MRRLVLLLALVFCAHLASAQTPLNTNAYFDNGTTGWTVGAGWTYDGSGRMLHRIGSTADLAQSVVLTGGPPYTVSLQMTRIGPAGSLTIGLGASTTVMYGSGQVVLDATGAVPLTLTPSSDCECTVDAVVVAAPPAAGGGGGGGGGGPATVITGEIAPPAGNCDALAEVGALYIQSGDPALINLQFFRCTQVGVSNFGWQPAGYNAGTAPPSTCSTGNLFFDTDAPAGANLFTCIADFWTIVGGLPLTGSTGIVVQTGVGSTAARTLTAGDGASVVAGNGVPSNPVVAVDATVGRRGSGSGAPPVVCGSAPDAYQLGDVYLDMTTNTFFICEAVNRFVPGRPSRGGLAIFEDFCGGLQTTGNIGETGMSSTNIGAGSTVATGTGTLDHPCVLNIIESVDLEGLSVYHIRGLLANTTITGRDWGLEVSISQANGATDQAIWVGLNNNAAGTPSTMSSFIGAVYNSDVGHTVWGAAMCDSATTGCQAAGDDVNQDYTASAETVVVNAYNKILVTHRNSGVGGTSTYYVGINNETPKTFCASGCDEDLGNLPTASLQPFFAVMDQAAVSRGWNIDYFRLWVTGLAR